MRISSTGIPAGAAVVVGNPRTGSRTRAVGLRVAEKSLAHNGNPHAGIAVIELAELGGALFDRDSPAVAAAKQIVLDSSLLVVASPVFKASYTGLLKSFLEQFGHDELQAKATVPVMVGSEPRHALAVEEQLRPILVEIGASCPTRGFFVVDSELDSLDDDLREWLEVWGDALSAVTARTRVAT